MPTVFVSYAHESDEHREQVLRFATFLRASGITAELDLWSEHARRDWSAWAIEQITSADFVIVVASERYRQWGDGGGPVDRHRGVQSETALLRELVYSDRAASLPRILPVVLPGHRVDQIPLFLQPHTASHYMVSSFTTAGAERLLRVILERPGHLTPPVGSEVPELPPHSGGHSTAVTEPARAENVNVVNQINGTVHGKVIQAGDIHGDITF
jgi:hypothetical protein